MCTPHIKIPPTIISLPPPRYPTVLRELFILAILAINNYTCAQKQTITWGDEFKLKKGSGDIKVLFTDETGVYVEEEHIAVGTYFVVGMTYRTSGTLVKLNHQLQEVYRNSYNRELKGKEFENFLPFKKKLFIVASQYNRGTKSKLIQVAEINKKTGQMGKWVELASIPKEQWRDDISFKLFPNADSSNIVLISTNTGKERNIYQLQEFDENLKPNSEKAIVTNEFEPKTFQLEDVLYTRNKKIIMVGRNFEFKEGRRKKEKFKELSHYTIRTYDEKGNQQSDINTIVNGKWIASTKLILSKDETLIMTCFFSKEKNGTINGLLVQQIDPTTGAIRQSTEKEINYAMLGGDISDTEEDKNESRAERKERAEMAKLKNEEEGFSSYLKFRDIFFTPDGGLVITAENYDEYTLYTSSGTGAPGDPSTSSVKVVYECREIIISKLDANNQISWLQLLPKSQRETTSRSSSSTSAGGGATLSSVSTFFMKAGRPFYAGFTAFQFKNNIFFYFNDHRKNADVVKSSQR